MTRAACWASWGFRLLTGWGAGFSSMEPNDSRSAERKWLTMDRFQAESPDTGRWDRYRTQRTNGGALSVVGLSSPLAAQSS